MKRTIVSALLMSFLIVPGGCSTATTRDIWRDVLSKCSHGDQFRNVLFFSMDSNMGPGSLWLDSPDNGYVAVRRAPADIDTVLNRGTPTPCNGVTSRFSSLTAEARTSGLSSIVPLALAPTIAQAEAVTLSTPSWSWDQILTGEFADYLDGLPADHAYVRDLLQNRLVIGRALRLNGYTASLTFSREAAAQLRASYPSVATAEAEARWTSEQSLEISGLEPVYVAVQMYRWDATGLSSNPLTELNHTSDERILRPTPESDR